MDLYSLIKTIHIISATILFGTGLGIAFFMFRSYFAESVIEKYYAAKTTVLADYCFTLPAVIIQPLSGIWLIWAGGYDWRADWLLISYGLYILAGLCWIPVVWIQIQLKKMVQQAMETGSQLPAQYTHYFRLWFILGWPAFGGLVVIFYLMVSKI